MGNRRSIPEGADPLSAILGGGDAKAAKPKVVAEVGNPARRELELKRRMAFDVSAELGERIRNCVMHLSGPPLHLNLSRFAEGAFLREIERLAEELNAGEEFPRRLEEPRPGRPLG